MAQITPQNIELFNRNLRYESPEEIVSFVLEISETPIVTTSFGAYSAAILHLCSSLKKDIPVIWCDTGYNTSATYKHVQRLTELLELNLDIFTPKLTTAFINNTLGQPDINNPNHELFSEQVKLEPFIRAFDTYQPDLWFTNLRKGQTRHRENLDILSFGTSGVLKVSPFYHFSDHQLLEYLEQHELPAEFDYYDPVKVLSNRECGIHLKK